MMGRVPDTKSLVSIRVPRRHRRCTRDGTHRVSGRSLGLPVYLPMSRSTAPTLSHPRPVGPCSSVGSVPIPSPLSLDPSEGPPPL